MSVRGFVRHALALATLGLVPFQNNVDAANAKLPDPVPPTITVPGLIPNTSSQATKPFVTPQISTQPQVTTATGSGASTATVNVVAHTKNVSPADNAAKALLTKIAISQDWKKFKKDSDVLLNVVGVLYTGTDRGKSFRPLINEINDIYNAEIKGQKTILTPQQENAIKAWFVDCRNEYMTLIPKRMEERLAEINSLRAKGALLDLTKETDVRNVMAINSQISDLEEKRKLGYSFTQKAESVIRRYGEFFLVFTGVDFTGLKLEDSKKATAPSANSTILIK